MKDLVKELYEDYWSKDRGDFASYFRNLALPEFFKQGEFVLDVGCGDGTVAKYLKDEVGVKIIGIDISESAVKSAKMQGIEAKVVDNENKLPFSDKVFDAVFWGDNIEHLFNPEPTAREIRRVLKRGGKLILSCPNMAYWRYRISYLLKGEMADTEWSGLPPWRCSHIRFFNIRILKEFLHQAGFNINKIKGLSPRRLDRPFLSCQPNLFGMVLLVEAS